MHLNFRNRFPWMLKMNTKNYNEKQVSATIDILIFLDMAQDIYANVEMVVWKLFNFHVNFIDPFLLWIILQKITIVLN